LFEVVGYVQFVGLFGTGRASISFILVSCILFIYQVQRCRCNISISLFILVIPRSFVRCSAACYLFLTGGLSKGNQFFRYLLSTCSYLFIYYSFLS
jgi:hypothetical protein